MKKILIVEIVEDELAYAKVLHDQLTKEGYEVIEAHDGKIGLELSLKEKPDLILLDIRMPVMDGVTMLKKLREDAWGKDVYVIILTNLDDPASISGAMHEKVSRYFIKSESELSAVITDVKWFLEK